jgi:hypothetical protein
VFVGIIHHFVILTKASSKSQTPISKQLQITNEQIQNFSLPGFCLGALSFGFP